MAVPFHRTSKTRRDKRRTHFKLKITSLVACNNCGKLIRSHTVCPSCGFYAKKSIIKVGETVKEIPTKQAEKKPAKKAKKAKPEAGEKKE